MFDRGNLGHLTQLCNRKSTLLIGKSSINGLFSIAMLNYQMVNNRTSHVGTCCHWSVSCCVLQVLWLFLRWENIKVPCQSSSTTSADAHSSGVMDGLLTHAGDVCWINPMEIPHMAAFPTCPVGKKPGPPRTLIGSYLYHQYPLIITNMGQDEGLEDPIAAEEIWQQFLALNGFQQAHWSSPRPLYCGSVSKLPCLTHQLCSSFFIHLFVHFTGQEMGEIMDELLVIEPFWPRMFTNPLQQKHSGSCLRPPLTIINHVTGLQLRC